MDQKTKQKWIDELLNAFKVLNEINVQFNNGTFDDDDLFNTYLGMINGGKHE